MIKIRERELELRRAVNQAQHEAGLQALLELAQIERDKALQLWRSAVGSDLVKYQSEYNTTQGIMDYILKAPREFASIPGAQS